MSYNNERKYAIENYGHGVLVADYSGKRGRFGAAYAGRDGEWRDQPVGIDPFRSVEEAKAFAESECPVCS